MTRSKAAERRQERQAEKRKQRLTSLALILIAAAILLLVLIVLATRPADAPIPDGTLTRYEDISQSRTDDGYARLGDHEAPVVVELYSSPACPSCKVFHDEAMDELIERVKAGGIQLIFVPLTTGSITNASGATRAMICATEQGKAWELQDVLFSWQSIFGNQAFTNNRLIAALDALGVNNDNYSACLSSPRPSEVLASAEQAASGLLNYIGTPTIAINGVVPTDENGQVINDSAGILAAIDRAVAQAPTPSGDTASPTTEPTSAGAEAAATAMPTEAATATPVPTEAATATDVPTATLEATATSGG